MSITEQKYRESLATHDWQYDYSDDYSVWARGKSQRAAILDMRKNIDPEGKIWNEYAPTEFKMK